jgi:hypothetical protein
MVELRMANGSGPKFPKEPMTPPSTKKKSKSETSPAIITATKLGQNNLPKDTF